MATQAAAEGSLIATKPRRGFAPEPKRNVRTWRTLRLLEKEVEYDGRCWRACMSIFNHNVYDNIRTRTIVLHRGCLLMIPPGSSDPGAAWRLPGGGLLPNESLAECARREVMEETGIPVHVGHIAFLREWIVPRHAQSTAPDPAGHGHGYGLEVFYYATPEGSVPDPRPEEPGAPPAKWVPLTEAPKLPLWPKELKCLCQRLQEGAAPVGTISILAQQESPLAHPEHDPFV